MTPRRRPLHQGQRALLNLTRSFARLVGGDQTVLILLGGMIGVLTGLVAVVFVRLVRFLTALAWNHELSDEPAHITEALHSGHLPDWYPLLVLPVGMLLVSWIVRRFSPEAGGHGVPEVMSAVATRNGRIRGSVGWVKMLSSSLNIGLGGSLGKEGPIVQVGSAFGSALGRMFKVKPQHMRTLVGCGAAAGIAAVFNAPIGGVMFALEIIIGTYELTSFTPIVIASVMGSVSAQRFLRGEADVSNFITASPSFHIPEQLKEGLTIVSPWEFAAYAILGLLAGLLSVGFTRSLYRIEDAFAGWTAPWWVHAVSAGLIVGIAGMFAPEVLGEGHDFMDHLLQSDGSDMPWELLLKLGLIKVLATAVTIGGGGSGGVFMPSLFVGAVFGGLFGQAMGALFPGQVAGLGAYALAGMAALLAGTAHAPLTGILLLFEMSDNYLLILPLMTVSVLATAVASRLLPDSIYTLKLSRRGIVVNDRQDTGLLRRLKTSDAMRPPVETISEAARFNEIVRRLLQSDQHDFPVVDSEGHLVGGLSLDDLREFLREEHLSQILVARDCLKPIDTLPPHSSLLEALEVFDRGDVYEIPVVSRGRMVGSLRRRDVMRTYRRALLASLPPHARRAADPPRPGA